MQGFKRTLKFVGILCLVFAVFNLYSLIINIYVDNASTYNIITSAICLGLSVLSGIFYLCQLRHNDPNVMASRKSIYSLLLFVNIFNGMIVWFISLWAWLSLNQFIEDLTAVYVNKKLDETDELDSQDLMLGKKLSEENIAVIKKMVDFTQKLKEIDNLKNTKQISEEEYKTLRKKLIDEF